MALQVAPFDRADAGAVDFIAEVAARSVSDNARYTVATASGVATHQPLQGKRVWLCR